MLHLNDLLKWKCFATLHKTFSHIYTQALALLLPLLFPLFLMASHHAPIPIVSSKKPQDINPPYVSFAFIKKKSLTSFAFEEDLIAQYTLWSNSDQLYLAPLKQGRLWPLPSYIGVCVLKLLCQLGASVLFNRLHMSRRCFRSIKDINPQVGCRWDWEIGCLCVQVDDCCYNKATIASKGSMGKPKGVQGRICLCVFISR